MGATIKGHIMITFRIFGFPKWQKQVKKGRESERCNLWGYSVVKELNMSLSAHTAFPLHIRQCFEMKSRKELFSFFFPSEAKRASEKMEEVGRLRVECEAWIQTFKL